MHDKPHGQGKMQALGQNRIKGGEFCRNPLLADTNAEPGAQGSQLGQIIVAAKREVFALKKKIRRFDAFG